MATQNIMGLFGMAPQDIQASRMADMQRNAMAQAQLSPMQLATYGAAMSGQQLGGLLRGALGGQDPEEVKALEVNKVASQIEWNDPKSILKAAQQLNAAGHIREAVALMQKYQEASLSQAQIGKETALKQKALTETETERLNQVATQMGQTGRAAFVKRKMPELTDTEAAALATEDVVKELLKDPTAEFKVETVDGRKKVYKVTPQGYQLVQDLGATGTSSLDALAGSIGALAAGMAAERGKKAAGAEGTEVGKAVAQIQSGYNAESAITDALDMVTQGIYAGGYGPLQELASKYTGGIIGDKNRLVNTEAFRSYIGNVVIPMMSQLGGSDSNEELKYMRSIVGGETTLEADAIQRILRRARDAVRKDIARKRAQQKAIQGSQPLPTGPMDNKEVNWSDL